MDATNGQVVIGEKVSMPSVNALSRPRVTDRVSELETSGVGHVHGAAGIGKTTALAQLADAWPGSVAWIRLDHGDGDEARLVALMRSALGLTAANDSGSIDGLIAELESGDRHVRPLVVFDDLHSIAGSEAEEAIHRLLKYRPRHVAVLMGSRHDCSQEIRALTGSFEPMLIDFDDLRFRVWEVDDLMRSHHDLPIPPADLHLLCRYTDGWAAALRLFWVATRDADPAHRSQLISGLRTSSGMMHDYLMTEVLSILRPEAKEFLVATAVFEQITPARADALLGDVDARTVLREIHAAGLFGDSSVTSGTYRCHDLLRTHLLGLLAASVGDDEATALQLRAAALAEAEHCPAEAIRYYARGGDFDSVRRILDTSGGELSSTPGRWIEVLPVAMREQDPFVSLTTARQLVRHGDLHEARARYRRAVRLLDSSDGGARVARAELRSLDAWLDREPAPAAGWVGNVAGLVRTGDRTPAQPAPNGFDGACRELLYGDLRSAAREFRDIEATEPGLTGVAAGAAGLFVDLVRGGAEACSPVAVRRVQQAAKRLDARAVERVVGAIARGAVRAPSTDPLSEECRQANDHLGLGLVRLIDGVALLHEGHAAPEPFAAAFEAFTDGAYEELARLAGAFHAVALGLTGADPADVLVDLDVRRPNGLLHLLLLVANRGAARAPIADAATSIGKLARGCDLTVLADRLQGLDDANEVAAAPARPTAAVRVLGSFAMERNGREVDTDLTPLHQEVLAFLVVHVGDWVHKDRLMSVFWPDKDDARAGRSLQVAVSKVRGAVEQAEIGTLERDGARYSFRPVPTTAVDLLEIRELLATSAEPIEVRAAAVERAVDSFGELVDDLGTPSWVVEPRRELRLAISRAALGVAAALVAGGDTARAGSIAGTAVAIDPGADELWQIAIDCSGAARARQLRRDYDDMLRLDRL